MGTDIHGTFQVKTYKDEKNEWVNIPIPDYFDARDYNLFAIIGGVRNGYGFVCIRI